MGRIGGDEQRFKIFRQRQGCGNGTTGFSNTAFAAENDEFKVAVF
jgi:hypothetical protein